MKKILLIALSISCSSFAVDIPVPNIEIGANAQAQINNILDATVPPNNDINVPHEFENIENNLVINAGNNNNHINVDNNLGNFNMLENLEIQNHLNI